MSCYSCLVLYLHAPTHLLQHLATCIDLFFTNQPQLVMESGIHSSVCSMCHHQIFFAKLNMKVEYPPLYELIFWDCSTADKASINRPICDIKDPPWMTNGIRSAMEIKNNAYKEYIRSGMRYCYYVRFDNLKIELRV